MVDIVNPNAELQHQIQALETQMHSVKASDVAAAFSQLSSGSNVRQADLWLQAFQKSRHSWRPLDELLGREDASQDLKFFAARTLAAKLKDGQSLEQLDATEQEALRHALSSHLRRFAAGPPVVRTQLCLAAGASWSLHAAALTPDEARGVMQQLGGALYDGSPVGTKAFIEFLTVLGEEARRVQGRDDAPTSPLSAKHAKHVPLSPTTSPPNSPPSSPRLVPRARNRKGRQGNRYALVVAAKASAPGVFAFASQQWVSNELSIRAVLLLLLARWLEFGGHDVVGIVTPLLPHALQLLTDAQCRASATDFLVEVAALAEQKSDMPELMNLVLTGIPDWVGYLQQLHGVEWRSNDEVQHSVTRVVCAFGEALSDRVVSGDSRVGGLLSLIMDCASHQDIEGIAALTFPFWARLADAAEDAGKLAPALAPHLLRLVDVLISASTLPTEVSVDEGESDFEQWRFEFMSHAVIDILRMTGAEGVTQAWRQIGSDNWRHVEAVLFVVQNTPNDVVKHIAQTILSSIPALSEGWRIRNSYIRLVARCGVALGLESGGLPTGLLQYIAAGLGDERTHSEAVLALWLLSTQCPHFFVDDSVYASLAGLLFQSQLGNAHVELIAEGVGRVIANSAVPSAIARIANLCSGVSSRVDADQKAGKGKGMAWEWYTLAKVAESHGLTCNADVQVAWISAWKQLWPPMRRVLSESFMNFRPLLQFKDEAADGIVHVLRGISGASRDILIPELNHVLEAVTEGMRSDPRAGLLDVVTVIVQAHVGSSNLELLNVVVQLLGDVSQSLLNLCRRDGVVPHCSLISSLCSSLSTITKEFPAAVFPPSVLATAIIRFSVDIIISSELIATLAPHCEVILSAIDSLSGLLDVSAAHYESLSALLLAGGGAAAYAIINATLNVVEEKANRPLEVARNMAVPLSAVWCIMPQLQRTEVLTRVISSSHLPPELCEIFVHKLLILPSTPPERCSLCNAQSIRLVHCSACNEMHSVANGVTAALISLYSSAPIEAQH